MAEPKEAPNTSNPDVQILPPDYSLKKMIGEDVDMKEVFSEAVIEKAQKSIDKHQDSFLEWAAADLESLNAHYKKAESNIAACAPEIKAIEEIAHRLKSQAGTFQYELATHIAKMLGDFCTHHPQPSTQHLVVIRKHMDTLSVIFSQKIKNDGGTIGKELTESLVKLTEKFNA